MSGTFGARTRHAWWRKKINSAALEHYWVVYLITPFSLRDHKRPGEICAEPLNWHNLAMSKVRRLFYFQLIGLGVMIAVAVLLSWFFPIVDFVTQAQQQVMHWGPWSAVGYPVLFALCKYIFWTSLGRAPGLFVYTYLGTLGQLGLNVARGKSHPRVVEYWTWGGTFVTTALLFVLLVRLALQAIQKSSASGPVSHKGARTPLAAPFGRNQQHLRYLCRQMSF